MQNTITRILTLIVAIQSLAASFTFLVLLYIYLIRLTIGGKYFFEFAQFQVLRYYHLIPIVPVILLLSGIFFIYIFQIL